MQFIRLIPKSLHGRKYVRPWKSCYAGILRSSSFLAATVGFGFGVRVCFGIGVRGEGL